MVSAHVGRRAFSVKVVASTPATKFPSLVRAVNRILMAACLNRRLYADRNGPALHVLGETPRPCCPPLNSVGAADVT